MMRKTVIAAMLATFVLGCQESAKPTPAPAAEKKPETKPETKHSGWWCDEHGVPEAECSLCSPKVAKACKDAGDWCAKHDRANRQCFLCEPKLKEKFAAQYRTKYGKEPPPTQDD